MKMKTLVAIAVLAVAVGTIETLISLTKPA